MKRKSVLLCADKEIEKERDRVRETRKKRGYDEIEGY